MMRRYFSNDDIRNLVAHHPPTSQDVIDAHEALREHYGDLMVILNDLLPEGDLKIIAIRKAHEALQAANTCIAVTQDIHRVGPIRSTCKQCEHGIIKHAPPGSQWKHEYSWEGPEHDPVLR